MTSIQTEPRSPISAVAPRLLSNALPAARPLVRSDRYDIAAALGAGQAAAAGAVRSDLRPIPPSGYVADIDALNRQWPVGPRIESIEDALSCTVDLGNGQKFKVPLQVFGGKVNVIPLSNGPGVDAAGQSLPKGDSEVAKLVRPGELLIAVTTARPQHRTLTAADLSNLTSAKETVKFWDPHAQVYVGVQDREGNGAVPGVALLESPPSRSEGGNRFTPPNEATLFMRPTFPSWLGAAQVQAYEKNIATMLAGFEPYVTYPTETWNTNDPVAARSPETVRLQVEKMIRAVAGDERAQAWFAREENKLYCSEYVAIGINAGILCPLNRETWEPVVGREVWTRFEAAASAHTTGRNPLPSPNADLKRVPMYLSPPGLKPMTEYAPADIRPSLEGKLGIPTMTVPDMIDEFVSNYLPRERFGESLAPAQAAVLTKMLPALREAVGLDKLPQSDPRRRAAEQLFNDIVGVVRTQYGSYREFRAALEGPLSRARAMATGQNGAGLYVPPSLLQLVGQGTYPGGLVGLEYVATGIDVSLTRQQA